MPYMPRADKKAEKLAWKILGKPENIASKQTPRQKAINAKIDYEINSSGR